MLACDWNAIDFIPDITYQTAHRDLDELTKEVEVTAILAFCLLSMPWVCHVFRCRHMIPANPQDKPRIYRTNLFPYQISVSGLHCLPRAGD